jgi:hypothetical protein
MAEVDPFATSDDGYSLGVYGAMNPAIHHPRWYLTIGVLNQAEVDEAEGRASLASQTADGSTQASSLVCTPLSSQFTVRTLRVICFQNQWWIATTDAASLARMRDICDAVFKALPHTPVSAFTFNFAFHRATKQENVGAKLAALAERLPFGFRSEPAANAAASFQYRVSVGGRDVNLSVEPSMRDPKKIFVGFSVTHRIQGAGLFDLRPMLDESLERDPREARDWLSRVLAAIEVSDA